MPDGSGGYSWKQVPDNDRVRLRGRVWQLGDNGLQVSQADDSGTLIATGSVNAMASIVLDGIDFVQPYCDAAARTDYAYVIGYNRWDLKTPTDNIIKLSVCSVRLEVTVSFNCYVDLSVSGKLSTAPSGWQTLPVPQSTS